MYNGTKSFGGASAEQNSGANLEIFGMLQKPEYNGGSLVGGNAAHGENLFNLCGLSNVSNVHGCLKALTD